MRVTIKAKIVAIQNGEYTKYVVECLDKDSADLYHFLTITKCPNWLEGQGLKIGDTGFLEYETANAGDTYYNSQTGTQECYKYTARYFINFIKSTKDDSLKEFKF